VVEDDLLVEFFEFGVHRDLDGADGLTAEKADGTEKIFQCARSP
jgi:hypothetical protein